LSKNKEILASTILATIFIAFFSVLYFNNFLGYYIHYRYNWLIPLSIIALSVFVLSVIIYFSKKELNFKKDWKSLISFGFLNYFIIFASLSLFFVPRAPLSNYVAEKRRLNYSNNIINARTETYENTMAGTILLSDIQSTNNYPENVKEDILNNYYANREVRVKGFITKNIEVGGTKLYELTNFVISCCAVDATTVSALLETQDSLNNNQWLKVIGKIKVIEYKNSKTLIIKADEIEKISPPNSPYEYPE